MRHGDATIEEMRAFLPTSSKDVRARVRDLDENGIEATLAEVATPTPVINEVLAQWAAFRADDGSIHGSVAVVDHFGNGLTTIPASLLRSWEGVQVQVGAGPVGG